MTSNDSPQVFKKVTDSTILPTTTVAQITDRVVANAKLKKEGGIVGAAKVAEFAVMRTDRSWQRWH